MLKGYYTIFLPIAEFSSPSDGGFCGHLLHASYRADHSQAIASPEGLQHLTMFIIHRFLGILIIMVHLPFITNFPSLRLWKGEAREQMELTICTMPILGFIMVIALHHESFHHFLQINGWMSQFGFRCL